MKNIFGDDVHYRDWEFWMDIAERNFKTPNEFLSAGDLEDANGMYNGTFDAVVQVLKRQN